MFPALLSFGRVYEELVLIVLSVFGVHFYIVYISIISFLPFVFGKYMTCITSQYLK